MLNCELFFSGHLECFDLRTIQILDHLWCCSHSKICSGIGWRIDHDHSWWIYSYASSRVIGKDMSRRYWRNLTPLSFRYKTFQESLAMNGVTHHRRIQCRITNFSALWKVILVCHFFDIIPIIVVRLLPRKTENTEETTPLKEEIEIPLDTLENPAAPEEKTNI